jgi:hypothetical protein
MNSKKLTYSILAIAALLIFISVLIKLSSIFLNGFDMVYDSRLSQMVFNDQDFYEMNAEIMKPRLCIRYHSWPIYFNPTSYYGVLVH